ncbi:ABC transporter substrate-binding protein, partial [Pseudomonas aeruginosa]
MRPRSALRYSLLLLAFAASAAIQAQPKTLAVCTEAAPEGFDPARYTSGYTFDASAHPLYNALAAFAPGSATVIPALAESWDVSADGLVYTFRLRQGVKFHSTDYFKPSREFNADDVLFSFQRMLDPQHPAHDLSPSGYPYADAMQLRDIIERIEKIDEHQVRFVLKHPEAPFLADLAMPFGSILSAEYAGQLIARGKGDELNSKPIGTGPFVFTRYRKDAQVRYAANPDYWKGKPAIDHLVLAITLDPNVRVQRLRRNECQIALTPKPEDVAALRQ